MVAKGSSLGLKLAIERFDLAPTLVTLPSMSLIPFAPLKLGSLPRSSHSYPRHFTFYVAHPSSLHSAAMLVRVCSRSIAAIDHVS